MNTKYRRAIIGGNWKMNLLPSEIKAYVKKLLPNLPPTRDCEVIICPSFISLGQTISALRGTGVAVAAQNVSEFPSGAYTGEVSAPQLSDIGATHVIVGHSERRIYFGEKDLTVNRKVLTVLEHGMRPIVCIGESGAIRDAGAAEELVSFQLKTALHGVAPQKMRRVAIAYEPVWAIGTGKTATAQQAGDMCAMIRTSIRKIYGARIARSVSILYGGSMNGDNAPELLAQPDIDGGLIGGASLKVEDFCRIISAAIEESAKIYKE